MPNRLQIVTAYLVWLSRLLTHLATYDQSFYPEVRRKPHNDKSAELNLKGFSL